MTLHLNLRAGVRVARESDAMVGSDIPAVEVPETEVETVLADPVSAEVATVAAAADATHNDGAVIDEMIDEAEHQETLAATLEEQAAAPETMSAGAVELAVKALERCRFNYNLPTGMTIARESMGTTKGLQQVYLGLAREASNNGSSLKDRAIQGAKDLYAWLKNFFAELLDKRKRLLGKAEALRTKANGLKTSKAVAGDAKVSISGNAASIGGTIATDPAALCEATASLLEGYGMIATLAQSSFGADVQNAQADAKGAEETDLNPKKVGNVKVTVKYENKRATVTKEAGEAPAAVEIAPLSLDEVIKVSEAAKKAVVGLQAAEKAVKDAEKSVGGTLGKLKALATRTEKDVSTDGSGTNKVNEVKQDFGAIWSRLRAVSSIGSTLSSLTLSAVDSALTTAQKSLAAYKAPAAAAK